MVKFTKSPDLSAKLDVYVQDISEEAVSDYLFGKFTEHLGRNIYHGMWAQILVNPGFEPSRFFGVESPNIEEIAHGWSKYGEGDMSCSVVQDCVGVGTSQRIEVKSLKNSRVGIQQNIYLPLHREKDYELSLWVKGDVKEIIASVETEESKKIGEVVISGIKPEWNKHFVKFSISDNNIEKGQPLNFSLTFDSKGTAWIDHCFLFPADNIEGFDPDIVRLVKESNLTLLRYPGGNFVSQYRWKDGIGRIENRPIRFNKAWNMAEYNHVGTDEFMTFCSLVGAEPMICVNAGNGTPQEASDWVEYCVGDTNTEYGKLRAENGHPSKYNIKFWEIGNELYGSWQEGHCTAEEYAKRYEQFYKAMSSVSPNVKFIANGFNWGWDKQILEENSETVRSLSRHYLIGGGVRDRNDQELVYRGLIAYTYWLEGRLENLKDKFLEYIREPKVAITELQVFTNRPNLPNNSTLSESLFYSGIVNTSIRMGKFIEMITHSALVNHGGGLRKEREFVYANPVYYARKLYATQPGRISVGMQITTPMFDFPGMPQVPAIKEVPYIDAIALLNDDRRLLSLIITNRHPSQTVETAVSIHGFDAQKIKKMVTLSAPSYMSRNSFEEPELVKTVKEETTERKFVLPAHSITLLLFKHL